MPPNEQYRADFQMRRDHCDHLIYVHHFRDDGTEAHSGSWEPKLWHKDKLYIAPVPQKFIG